MILPRQLILLALGIVSIAASPALGQTPGESQDATPSPPTPVPARDFSKFEFLMTRSPFSLPTAEEKSPMGDRYAITGAASWDGQQRIFIVDKTSQERLIISSEPNKLNMSLLEFLPDGDPRRMRARVKIGSEVATLEFAEMAPSAGASAIPIPGQAVQLGIQQPGGAVPQISSTGPPGAQPVRRIIRRRVITGAPPPAQ
ncbi:MAG: hypothetical protein Fur0032_19730 [Terrimicrobiaceae bacterium]